MRLTIIGDRYHIFEIALPSGKDICISFKQEVIQLVDPFIHHKPLRAEQIHILAACDVVTKWLRKLYDSARISVVYDVIADRNIKHRSLQHLILPPRRWNR